ncbi:hypothetical protein IGI04_042431 [Brassica rapa subsp. trilocularis]|uniref:Uncharacterized protein n=1 Tax=Brassica rapa subsp. trilocularis TaxID=1813537 RepID=A0ABQ7KM02_BRACM|nr:hypothetical protein IGI04_042431 [Brassica rapa subsp. trilocularis]
MSVAVRVCPSVSVTTHRTSVAVHQYTYQHVSGRLWLSISTHISTLVLGLSTLALPVDCSGDFGPCGLSVQYTQDVRGCPSAHTGRLWVSVSTHRTSVAVRVCLCVSISTHRTSVAVRSTHISTLVLGLRTLTLPVDCSGDFGPRGLSVQYTGCPWVSVSTHRTSVCLRQHTQDVCGCLCVSLSTHRKSMAVHQYTYQHVGPCTHHADPSRGMFGTHRTFVAVHQYTYHYVGRWTQHAGPPRGLTHRTSVGVRQHTEDVCVCPSAHTGRPWLSVCVRVCLSAHTGRPWLSISTHICTLVLGLSTLALPVDCSGDFGPRGLSVQYTQDVCGCPQAHTGRPWLFVAVREHTHDVCGCPCVSVCVYQHTQDVCGCPSVHISALWSLDSARWPFPWTVRMILAHVCCLFSKHRTSVGVREHTQDIRGCSSAHTGRPWLSVCVCVWPCVSLCGRVWPSAHTGRPWLSISTHISTLVLGLSTLTLHMDCLGILTHVGCLFSTHRSPWVSASTHRTSVAVRVCPCVSICVRQHTQDVRGCPSVHISLRWSLDSARWPSPWTVWVIFGPRGLYVQYTQDVRGCPLAHTGRTWLSVCVRVCVCVRQDTQDLRGCLSAYTGRLCVSVSTHRTSVAVRVCLSAHTGRPWLSISKHISTLVLGLSTMALPVDCSGDFGPRGLSIQYTQDVRGCPTAHTGRLWVSVSTHRTFVAVRVCLCVSVCVRQHTQDVCGCPSVHISARWSLDSARWPFPWTVRDVRGCSWPSVSTHRTSVAVRVCPCVSVCVHQHTQDVCGCPSVHISALWSLDSARWPLPWTVRVILAHVCCLFSRHRTSVGVRQHTQDIRGCPSAHTGRLWLSVCVSVWPCVSLCGRVWPSAHTGRPWLSISTHRTLVAVRVCPCVSVSTHRTSMAVRSTHISTLVLGLRTLTLPVDCSGDFGPRGLSVQYTGCLWVSVSTHRTSLCVRQHTQDVCGCLCVSLSTHRKSMAVHQYTYQHVGPCTHHADPSRGMFGTHRTFVAVHQYTYHYVGRWTQHAGPPRGLTHRTSVGVRQHTQDVCVCPSAHAGRPWLSVCVRVCLSAHTGCPWLSISTHISTLVLGLSTLALPVDCSCDFGPLGLLVQYIQDVCGCPQAHTGHPWLFVAVREHTHHVCGCPCVSVCVYQHTQDVCGCPSVHISALWSLDSARWPFPWTVRVILAHVCCLFSRHRTSMGVRQHTQDIRGCPSAHTGRLWLSVCVCVWPCVAVSHTQDVLLSISTHVSTVGLGLSTLNLQWTVWVSLAADWLSVQYNTGVRGCQPAHTGRPWLSVCVRVCPSVSSAHNRTFVACPSVHNRIWSLDSARWPSPWTVWMIFGPRGLTHRTSVGVRQHTEDVCVCPSAHTGRPWLSVCVRVCLSAHTGRPWLSISTHICTLVLGLSTLALPVDCSGDFGPRGLSVQYTQDVCGCPQAHTGRPWLFVAVREHTHDVCGCPCVSVCVYQHTQDVCGCPSVHISALWSLDSARWPFPWTVRMILAHVCCLFSKHRTSVGVREHTQDIRGCSSAHTGRPWLSVCVCVWPCVSLCGRVWPSAHTGRPWLSISTHISTLVLGLSTLTLHMDCLGILTHVGCLFSTHRSPWVSASTHRTSVAVRVCPCVSICVRQHTQDVRGCPSVHISLRWSLDSARWPSPWTVWVIFGPRGLYVQYTQDVRGCPLAHTGRTWLSVCVRVCVCVRQDTQDLRGCLSAYTGRLCVSVSTHRTSVAVRVCLSAHTGRPWLSISKHISTLVLGLSTMALPVDCSGDFGPRGLSIQYTQDVRGCPTAHTGPHTGRPWLSISTHISTLVLGLSTLALLVDCSGDFGPRGLSVQYTQDIRGCPQAHTGRPWLFVAVRQHTHDVCGCPCVSVCVYQHTQDVCGCPSVHISALWSLDSARWPLPWTVRVILAHVCCLFSRHRTSVGVRQHTQDIRGCPSAHTGRLWLSVCVSVWPCVSLCGRVWPSAHTGRPWLSISTHRTLVAVRVCPCVSVSTHRTSMAVRSTHISTLVLGLRTLTLPVDCSGDFGPRGLSVQYTGCLWVSVSTHRTSLCVRQHTQDVCGCLCVSLSTHRKSMAVHQYTYQHVGPCTHHADPSRGMFGTHRTFVAVHQYTYHYVGRWTQHAGPPRGLTHRTSVGVRQHTQDVCVCPSAHAGRPWLSVCVRVCLSAHTGCPWLSISTHISTLVLGLSTLALPVDCSCDFGPLGLLVQYIQDVCGCPQAHTGHPWLFVAVREHTHHVCGCPCVSVCVYQHTQDVCGCPSVHISALWSLDSARWPFPWTVRVILAHVCCLFSRHRTSMGVRQHTQDIRGCPSAHTGRLWLSVCVCVWPCVSLCGRVWPSAHTGRPWLSISTHRTLVAVRVCPCVSVSTHRTSMAVRSTHISTLVLGLRTLTLPVDCSGDFGPRGLSVQYTGCLWVSVSTHRTSLCVRQHTQDVCGCLCVSLSTHRTSVAVHQYTYQHAGPWTHHAGPSRGLFRTHRDVRWFVVSIHSTYVWSVSALRTERPRRRVCRVFCFVSTHRMSAGCPSVTYQQLVLGGLSIAGPFPAGLFRVILATWAFGQSIQTLWVSASTTQARPWLFVVSVRTHTTVCGCPTSVAAHQYTYQHVGPWTQHAGPSRGLFGTHRTSVAVRVCPSAHTGHPWLSVSTHISTLVLGLSTLTLPVDCSGDFGPRGLSVQYTHDLRGYLSAHTRCPCVSVSTPRTSVAVFVCPSAHTGRLWLSISTHTSTLVLALSTLTLPVDCSGDFGPRGLSVQYTQDVRGCPPAHTGRQWLSVCVRVCPSVSVSTHMTSVAVHQYTYHHVGHWTQHAGPPRGLFGTSVGVRQHTQDVCVCPSAHTGRPWLSVCVCVCPSAHTGRLWLSISTHISTLVLGLRRPWVSVSTHKTSVAVRVCLSAHTGRPWLSISTHISTLVLGLSTMALPVDCSGDFGPRGLSVQYTQDVCGCPLAHTGRPWLSVSTHRTFVAVCQHTRTFVGPVRCVRQHTQDVRGCPSVHISARWPFPGLFGDFGPRGLSVQYTQDVCGCPQAHTGCPWLFVAVREHTHDVCGCPCVSVCVYQHTQDVCGCPSVHISALWSMDSARWPFPWTVRVILAHVCCLFSKHRTSVGVRQHTQDIRGCPSAHAGRPWLSVCVCVWPCVSLCGRVWPCVAVSTHRTSVAVHQYTYQHVGPWTQHADPSRRLFG